MKLSIVTTSLIAFLTASCVDRPPTADEKQAAAQAVTLEQAHLKVGMPAIGNFSEKRMMKDLYEMRDKTVPTHAYIVNEVYGCLNYLGPAAGYGLPYATQYTSPTKVAYVRPYGQDLINTAPQAFVETVPQPEPNGLFMPAGAEGTWIMLKDPNGPDLRPVYVEPRVVVSPFRLTNAECPPPAAPGRSEPSKIDAVRSR